MRIRSLVAVSTVLAASCTAMIEGYDGVATDPALGYIGDVTVEAETMTLPAANGTVTNETAASGGKGLLVWSNASATKLVNVGSTTQRIIVRARGESCNGAPQLMLHVDGIKVLSVGVASVTYAEYRTTFGVAPGLHVVTVAFTNDALVPGTCDRNLYVDSISFAAFSAPPGPVAPPGYQVYFDDEFVDAHGGAPNPAWWDYDIDYVRNNELQCYTDNRRDNVRVETRTIDGAQNGVLVLQARKENWMCPQAANAAYQYTSGSITSRTRHYGAPKVEMPFGRYEIRAKLPRGRGVWPAIWFVGSSSLGQWPRSGEIDLMEQVGYEEARGLNRFYSTLHKETTNSAWPNRLPNETGLKHQIDIAEPVSANFHVFAMEWEPGRITFWVDDNVVGTRVIDYGGQPSSTEWHDAFVRSEIPNTSTPLGWPYAKETPDAQFHMIINLAFGGAWGGAEGIDDSIFGAGDVEMLVDYVRIYTKL
jgi:hypothetical protein